jgi:hypothetical protein
MNRFLPCRSGILSCQGLPSSTVKNGGCSIESKAMAAASGAFLRGSLGCFSDDGAEAPRCCRAIALAARCQFKNEAALQQVNPMTGRIINWYHKLNTAILKVLRQKRPRNI